MEFDPSQFDPNAGSFEAIPAGTYKVEVESAEFKSNKAENGKLVSVCFSILGDNFANRKLFHNFNIVNPNEKAVEIGCAQFAGFLYALDAGKVKLDEVERLQGKVLNVKVLKKFSKFKGDMDNEISKFEASAPAGMPAVAGADPALDKVPF